MTSLPQVTFTYVPISDDPAICSIPKKVNLSNYTNKRIVITGAPAAFSPTCSVNHIPKYVEKVDELRNKGVDHVFIVTRDNPYANQAWAKQLGATNSDYVVFVTDPDAKFSQELGYVIDGADGTKWCSRYAIIVDNGKITYSKNETNPATEVTVSDVGAVLAKL